MRETKLTFREIFLGLNAAIQQTIFGEVACI